MRTGTQTRRQKILLTLSFVFILFLLVAPLDIRGHLSVTEAVSWADAKDAMIGISDFFSTVLANPVALILLPLSLILSAMIKVMSLLMTGASMLFDVIIQFTIIDYSTHLGGSIQDGINTVWVAFRDLANIALIGMFVYIAFMVMLNVQSFSAEKFAARVLIIALLINFSLFFTKVIIDMSNITAIQFYKTISVDGGIGKTFIKRSGITSTYNNQSYINQAADVSTAGFANLLSWGIFTSLLFAGVASIFVYATILLFSRALTFIFLMVTSPLAFAAFMIPRLEKHWDTWLSLLINNALFAPLLMMMLWATLTITSNLQGDGKALADIIGGEFDAIGGIFNIVIILGLLYASIKISSSLSLMGQDLAEKMARKTFGFGARWSGAGIVARGVTGVGSFFAQKTVSGGAAWLQQLNKRPPRGLNWMLNSARLDKQLDTLKNSAMRFGDSQIAKALEKHTGISSKASISPDVVEKFRRGQLDDKSEREEKIDAEKQAQGLQTIPTPTTNTQTAGDSARTAHDSARATTETDQVLSKLRKNLESSQKSAEKKRHSLAQTTRLARTATNPAAKDRYKKHAENIKTDLAQEEQKIRKVKKDIDALQKERAPSDVSSTTRGGGGRVVEELRRINETLETIGERLDTSRVQDKKYQETRVRQERHGDDSGVPPAGASPIDISKYEYQEPTGIRRFFSTARSRDIERKAWERAKKPKAYYRATGKSPDRFSNEEVMKKLQDIEGKLKQ